MSKLVTNFGDVVTTGNTTLQQNLVVQGATTTLAGNLYTSSPFSTIGNATSKFLGLYSTSANLGQINTNSLYGTSGVIGISTTPVTGGATLQVQGNVSASNSITAQNVFATTLNSSTSNVSTLYGVQGVVGINTAPVAGSAQLQVQGNIYASNAIQTPVIIASTRANIGSVNTQSIYSPTGQLGIGTSTNLGASLQVQGNVYVSNAIVAPTVTATTILNTPTLNTGGLFGTYGILGVSLLPVAGGATLQVQGNAWASTNITAPTLIATTSMNTTTTNTTALYGTAGQIGIGTATNLGATLQVQGNIYASNAIQTPSVYASSINVPVANVTSVYGPVGLVGFGTDTPTTNLHVQGNIWASNAIVSPLIIATTVANATTLNTTSIYGTSGQVGFGTATSLGATVQVLGNIFASNTISAQNLIATNFANIATLNVSQVYSTTGVLGIGTTNPGASFHVYGNVYASNAIQTPSAYVSQTVNISATLNTTTIYGTTGLVGIGTSTPGSSLDVYGNIYASNAIQTPSVYATQSANATIANVTAIYGPVGLVGIGTQTPGSNLDVYGNVLVSNAITTTNIFSNTINISTLNVTSIFSNGTSAVTINAPVDIYSGGQAKLAVNGNIYCLGLTTTNITTPLVNITTTLNTATIFSPTGTVGINTTATGASLQVGGNVYASNAFLGPSAIVTTLNVSTLNTTLLYGTTGKIGLNTTSPAASLHVGGNVFVSNAIQTPQAYIATINTTNLNTTAIFSTVTTIGLNTNTGIGANLHVIGNVYASNAIQSPVIITPILNATTTNVTALYGPAGLVGVGTSTGLGANLHVYGNIYVSNAVQVSNLSVNQLNVTTLNVAYILPIITSIGVGTTTNIGANLHVQGNIYASNALQTPCVYATISANIVTLNTSTIFGTQNVVGFGVAPTVGGATVQVQGNVYVSNAVQTGNYYILTGNIQTLNVTSIYGTAGQVGIGTSTSLGANLHVYGNAYASNSLQTTGNVIAPTANIPVINTTVIYGKTGQVGVGTSTTLGANLQVQGNIYASNAFQAPSVYATTLNTTTVNVTAIYSRVTTIGVNTTTGIGANLHVIGNVYASNAVQAPVAYLTSVNATVLNTTGIYGTTTSTIGINTNTGMGANLHVIGNVYASNAFQGPAFVGTSFNATTINTTSITNSTYKIGVGTNTGLGANLHVIGNIYASNAIQTQSLVAASANIINMNVTSFYGTAGMVGINTATPTANLYVYGNTTVSNAIQTPNAFVTTFNTTTANVLSLYGPQGYIGIGTATPTANLHVMGNVYVSNALQAGALFLNSVNVSTLNLSSLFGTSGQIGVGTSTSLGATLQVQGNTWIANSLTTTNVFTTNINTFYINTSYIYGTSGRIGIGTSTNLGANLHVQGNIYASNAIQTPLLTGVTTGNITTINATAIMATSAFQIGINTNTGIGANLHVIGNIYVSNALQVASFTPGQVNSTVINTTAIFSNVASCTIGVGTNTGVGANLHVIGNVYASNAIQTPSLLVTNANITTLNSSSITSSAGRIGINTTTGINANLHVIGNVYVSNSIQAQNWSPSTVNTTMINTISISNATGLIGINTSTGLGANLHVYGNVYASNAVQTGSLTGVTTGNITTLNTTAIMATSSFQVGINTTTGIGANLHVIGNVYISNTLQVGSFTPGQVNSATINTTAIFSNLVTCGVGINTSTGIGANLHVIGNVFASNAIQTPSAIVSTAMNATYLNTTAIVAQGGLQVGVNTTTGIGANLHVIGNIYASNAIQTPLLTGVTTGNIATTNVTYIYGPAGLVGVNTSTGIGANLHVQGNVYASNAVQTPSVYATTSANIATANVTAIFSPASTGFIGVNTSSGLGATLHVQGNVYVSNAFQVATFAPSNVNVTTANILSIYGPVNGLVGINTNTGLGANLHVQGNIYVTNALVVPAWSPAQVNSATINTQYIFSSVQNIGVNTNTGIGANLHLIGNLYASNAIQTTNLTGVTTGNITTINTSAIVSLGGLQVGVNTITGIGANLHVIGNVYASNAVQTGAIMGVTTGNITTINTSAIVSQGGLQVGVNTTTGIGANLHVIGNVYASNSIQTTNVYTNTLYVNSIINSSNLIGINTGLASANLHVVGNLFASNGIQTTNILGLTANFTNINALSIYSQFVTVGVTTTTTGANLYVQGNIYTSNAIQTPSIYATTSANTTIANVTYIYGTAGVVGVNTTVAGANLHVIGNVYASNAIQTTNLTGVTTGNITTANVTYIYGTAGLVGVNTLSGVGASLHVYGNIYAANSVQVGNFYGPATINITTLNTNSIFGPAAAVGIGTSTGLGGSLHILGNLFVSNALQVGNLIASNVSTPTLNVGNISSFSGSNLFGIGVSNATSNLQVAGNIWASNSLVTPNLITTAINTGYIFSSTGLVGVGTSTGLGANLHVLGNIYMSNSIQATNLYTNYASIGYITSSTGTLGIGITNATGASLYVQGNIYVTNAIQVNNVYTMNLSYNEDLTKRYPHFAPSSSNSSQIQGWVSGTTNVAYQTSSWWATSANSIYGNVTTSGPSGSLDYAGSVLLPDGRVLFVPFNASNVGMYNPTSRLFSQLTIPGIEATVGKFWGGVLLPNGNVAFVPHNSANIGMFNPLSYAYSNILSVTGLVANAFAGGVLTAQGNIAMVPCSSANVGLYNPVTGVFTNVASGVGGTTTKFQGGVLLPSGNVVFVPRNSSNIGMFDPNVITYTNIGPFYASGSAYFSGGVLAPNGNVVFVPFTGTTNVSIFAPTTSTISNVQGASSFSGGGLLPSGKIVMAPYNSQNVGVFDPYQLTYSNTAAAGTATLKFNGATVIPNGQVVFCPSGVANVGCLNTLVPAPTEFCLAPYFNKF